jgi:hypothetical protein
MSEFLKDDFLEKVQKGAVDADSEAAEQGSLIKYLIIYLKNGLPSKIESAYMHSVLTVEELEVFERARLESSEYVIQGPIEITDQGLSDSKINRYLMEKSRSNQENDVYRKQLVHGTVNGFKYMYSSWANIFTVDRFVSCLFSKKAIPKEQLNKSFSKGIEEGKAVKIIKTTLANGNEKVCWKLKD